MKLGIFLLILGLILAGAGVATWMSADPTVSFWFGDSVVQETRMLDASGPGLTVLGGGLALGGIIRMVVKR